MFYSMKYKIIMNQSKALKIYIVDDAQFDLNISEQIISNLGYKNITLFNSGRACLNKLKEKPDVVFLDYYLNTLTGYEVLKKIKKIDSNIYVVILSGQKEVKIAVDLLKHGAFDYIQKGINTELKIKQVLEKLSK